MRFPQTTPIDVAIKSLDCSQSSRGMEDLQNKEADRNWHRFGVGLGGFDAFVSIRSQRNLEKCNSVFEKYCSYLRIGERMTFYAFWS